MRTSVSLYRRHRFPTEIITHCVLADTLQEVAAGYDRDAEHNIVAARMEDESLTT